MDPRLERLKLSFMNSWFPTDGKIFLNEEGTVSADLIDIFFADFMARYNTAFPAVMGRVYTNYVYGEHLELQAIDDSILRILGITTTYSPFDQLNGRLTGRDVANSIPSESSPYMSEQAAMDLYNHITVDEWSGRMDRPIIMYNDVEKTEYIIPSLSDFIVIYLRERSADIELVPSSLYPSVEAYFTYNLANIVLNALGRYPISLALKDIDNVATGNPSLDASNLSSLTISGKITLSMSNSAKKAYEKLSELFSSGIGNRYMNELENLYKDQLRIFNVLKITRLNGISST